MRWIVDSMGFKGTVRRAPGLVPRRSLLLQAAIRRDGVDDEFEAIPGVSAQVHPVPRQRLDEEKGNRPEVLRPVVRAYGDHGLCFPQGFPASLKSLELVPLDIQLDECRMVVAGEIIQGGNGNLQRAAFGTGGRHRPGPIEVGQSPCAPEQCLVDPHVSAGG